ncbi:MAG: hypothetical protein J7L66_00335 [Anaerolineaceae bacterium]|nr:hypothetical protein [Anaerolineaceae bacterium]
MSKKTLLISLMIGIAFDVLFWKKTPGISFMVFIVLWLTVDYLLLREKQVTIAKSNLPLLISTFFFSLMIFIRLEPFTVFLNYMVSFLTMAILTMTYQNGIWQKYGLFDYIINLISLAGEMLSFSMIRLKK